MDDSQDIAARVREELARRRMSRLALADSARISLSTLEKALSGGRPFTLGTLVRLETALGVSLRPTPPSPAPDPPGLAPASLGAYSRTAVRRLEGRYITLRPSFSSPGDLFVYRTEIAWDKAASCLAFTESARTDSDFTQRGQVSISHESGHIYMLTSEQGQFRLAVLSRPTRGGVLLGLLTTLHAGRGAQLTPASSLIAYVPEDLLPQAPMGLIGPGNPAFQACRDWLDRVAGEGYAQFFPG
ncbi:MAG: transcriptional regulator [Caulobacter sp.]|nr:transcriptional regulator [Caulobacter sp.]